MRDDFTEIEIGVSSMIHSMQYSTVSQTLRVAFYKRPHGLTVVRYRHVPSEVVARIEDSANQIGGSVGKTFNELVKSQPNLYPFEYEDASNEST